MGVQEHEICLVRANRLLGEPATDPVSIEFGCAYGLEEVWDVAITVGSLEAGSTGIRGRVPMPDRERDMVPKAVLLAPTNFGDPSEGIPGHHMSEQMLSQRRRLICVVPGPPAT
jgi:hypothetical protein